MDKLEAMNAFAKVVALGSYAEAARVLGLTRSAVSKAVMELEHHLGARLLDRTTRRVGPTEAGLASLYEKYENNTDSDTQLSAQLGYMFDMKLGKNLKLIHDLTYYPSTEQFSDYYLTSTGEIRAHFTENMFLNFKAILNYDKSPAVGAGTTDAKYLLGVGYSF